MPYMTAGVEFWRMEMAQQPNVDVDVSGAFL